MVSDVLYEAEYVDVAFRMHRSDWDQLAALAQCEGVPVQDLMWRAIAEAQARGWWTSSDYTEAFAREGRAGPVRNAVEDFLDGWP